MDEDSESGQFATPLRTGKTDRYSSLSVVLSVVGLTALTLSCAAGAYVPAPLRRTGCCENARRRNAICNRCDAAMLMFGRGASAPGRSRAAPASAWS